MQLETVPAASSSLHRHSRREQRRGGWGAGLPPPGSVIMVAPFLDERNWTCAQGRRQGDWAMAPLRRRRRTLRLFGALQSRMCLQGKCSWWAPSGALQRRQVPPKSLICFQGSCSWRPPSGSLQQRKVSPKKPSNDDRTAPSLGEVVHWCSPIPCPHLRDFLNTLLHLRL